MNEIRRANLDFSSIETVTIRMVWRNPEPAQRLPSTSPGESKGDHPIIRVQQAAAGTDGVLRASEIVSGIVAIQVHARDVELASIVQATP